MQKSFLEHYYNSIVFTTCIIEHAKTAKLISDVGIFTLQLNYHFPVFVLYQAILKQVI